MKIVIDLNQNIFFVECIQYIVLKLEFAILTPTCTEDICHNEKFLSSSTMAYGGVKNIQKRQIF